MRAMLFDGVGQPLRPVERPVPVPGPGQVLLRVLACGICRTDLHLLDGEVEVASPPRILGHQIVGVDERTGRRVGVPWLGWTCGTCPQCRAGRENLCPNARFTGCDLDGGMRSTSSPTSASASRCPRISPTPTRRRCCAPG